MLPSDSHFSFQGPSLSRHTVLLSSVLGITELLLDKAQCSEGKLSQDQVAGISSSRELTQAHHSILLCWDFLCCLVWVFLHHPPFISICYFSPDMLVLHFPIEKLMSCWELWDRHVCFTSLFSEHLWWRGRKNTGTGEWNTYLKEKGLGRTSLCPLHSTSLCDY